jgi:hypothetical protein
MKRKAKKAAVARKSQLTTAELKKLYAGLQYWDGRISNALDGLASGDLMLDYRSLGDVRKRP